MPHGFDITTAADAYNTTTLCSVFSSCFVWGFSKCKCKCSPQGHPCLSRLSLSSVVSAALSSTATNPQRVTLSTHPHHYPHIFLAVVEPSVSVYETPAPLMLFVHQSSLKPTSQYRKYVCSLSLSVKRIAVRKSCDRFVILCRKMINVRHSFGICQTRKISNTAFARLKWTPPSSKIIHSHIWKTPPLTRPHI